MSSENIIAVRYAKALLALAQEQKIADALRDDLLLTSEYFAQGQEVLAHPLISLKKKMQIVENILGKRISSLTITFIRLLLQKKRGALVGEICKAYEQEWLLSHNRQPATVKTAIPLTAGQMKRLKDRLNTLYNYEVDVHQILDPSLRAGARVEMGDLVWDNTLPARLARLRRTLNLEN